MSLKNKNVRGMISELKDNLSVYGYKQLKAKFNLEDADLVEFATLDSSFKNLLEKEYPEFVEVFKSKKKNETAKDNKKQNQNQNQKEEV